MTDEELIHRMQVSWKKARNMYSTFFVMLDDKRKEIGDDKLADWCFYNLRISLSICIEVSQCLKEADKIRERENLANARRMEKEKLRAEAKLNRQHREAEKAKRDAEKAVKEAEAKKQKSSIPKPRRNNSGGRKRDSRDTIITGRKPFVAPSTDSPQTTDDLARGIHAAMSRLSRVRSEWIEVTLELASMLRQARERFPSDRQFAAWLKDNDLSEKLSHQDRSALINMAADLGLARAVLEESHSWSWRLIWQDEMVSQFTNAGKPVTADPGLGTVTVH